MEGRKLIVNMLFMMLAVCYLLTGDINNRLLLIYAMTGVGIAFFKADIMVPFVWLSPFVVIYNTSIYILDLLGVRNSYGFPIILNCVFVSILTMFVYSVLFIKAPFKHRKMSFAFITASRGRLLHRMISALSIILLLYIPLFLALGYTSKMETNENGGLPGFGIAVNLFEMAYTLYIIYHCHHDGRFPFKVLLLAESISLLMSLFLGERDVFFSISVISFLIYYRFFKPSIKTLVLVGSVGVFMIPILGMTKQITNKSELSFQREEILLGIFEGEFLSSGRNIETLLINKNDWSFQHGEALYRDVLRSLIPSSLVQIKNSTGWYNDRYNERVDMGFGAGFSYVGEGYLQGGYWGVAFWMLLLAIACHSLYRWSYRSVYGLASYAIMVCLIIYSMRGDFSYVISPLFKQILIQYIFFLFTFRFFAMLKRTSFRYGQRDLT